MHSDNVEANLWLERPAIIEQETVGQDVIVAQPARMLRATEIAVRFGCSPRTVNRWGRLGVLPVVKIQGSTFYRHSDVEALLTRALDRSIECVHAGRNRRTRTAQ